MDPPVIQLRAGPLPRRCRGTSQVFVRIVKEAEAEAELAKGRAAGRDSRERPLGDKEVFV